MKKIRTNLFNILYRKNFDTFEESQNLIPKKQFTLGIMQLSKE